MGKRTDRRDPVKKNEEEAESQLRMVNKYLNKLKSVTDPLFVFTDPPYH